MKYGLIVLFIVLFSCVEKKSNKLIEDIDFSKYFSSIEIIPLETRKEALIGTDITKCRILFSENKIYLLDKENNTIFIFSIDGKFIRKIYREGNGPGEYSLLADFVINRFTNNLELYSSLGEISVFDTLGTFIKKFKVPPFCHSFQPISNDKYVFFRIHEKQRLVLFSINKQEIQKEWYDVPEYFVRTPFNPLSSPFYVFNDTVFFSDVIYGKIYSICDSDTKLRYKWDISIQNLRINDIPKNKPIEFYFKWFQRIENKAYNFRSQENMNYIYSNFIFNKKLVHAILNKRTKELVLFPKINGKKFFTNIFNDECCMFITEPMSINAYISEKNMLSEKNYQILKSLKTENNPVLIKYVLK